MYSLKISLDDLKDGSIPGISPVCGSFLCETSKVCFDIQNHSSNVRMSLRGIRDENCRVIWKGKVDDQMKRTWADPQEVTEYGACGVAIVLILKLTDYTVIERSRKGTGFDYWLGFKTSELPFENSARLEVSGILNGDDVVFNSRVKQKRNQTAPTDKTNLPAFIVVVEFGEPKSKVVKK
jgi:hypothetical protein